MSNESAEGYYRFYYTLIARKINPKKATLMKTAEKRQKKLSI